MKMKFAGGKKQSQITFKKPGTKDTVTLKEGDVVEISDERARAFMLSHGKQLNLVPATPEEEMKLAQMMAPSVKANTGGVSAEEFKKLQGEHEKTKAAFEELKANMQAGAPAGASKEIAALQRRLKESESAQAQLSEKLAAETQKVSEFEKRLAALEGRAVPADK